MSGVMSAGSSMAQDGAQVLGLRDVKVAVEQAIKEAKRVSAEPPHFIIRKVELKLQGERKVAADGSVSFGIPVFGAGVDVAAKGSQTTREKLELELIPPESQVVGGKRIIDLGPLIRSLKDSFKADQGGGGLMAASVKYTYGWTLQLGAEGKVNVVVAKAGAAISEEKVQEITFHLCQTQNRSECIR